MPKKNVVAKDEKSNVLSNGGGDVDVSVKFIAPDSFEVHPRCTVTSVAPPQPSIRGRYLVQPGQTITGEVVKEPVYPDIPGVCPNCGNRQIRLEHSWDAHSRYVRWDCLKCSLQQVFREVKDNA